MKRLITLLQKQNKKIAVAESCTGGLITKMLTDVSGASSVFGYGVTAYANEAKQKLLGVKEETLNTFGAVSENTVREMALGVLELAEADISIAISGIAGPNNDGSTKPVGTVCIAVATAEKCYATTFVFAGKRGEIRRRAAKMALNMAYDELKTDKTAKPEKITRKEKRTAKKEKKTEKKALKSLKRQSKKDK
ncbi:MAG: CinA family protein [Clostridia bacterium]|nr:CinA family protein [Clostridia bacterium]